MIDIPFEQMEIKLFREGFSEKQRNSISYSFFKQKGTNKYKTIIVLIKT
jgi:hypothetical protein